MSRRSNTGSIINVIIFMVLSAVLLGCNNFGGKEHKEQQTSNNGRQSNLGNVSKKAVADLKDELKLTLYSSNELPSSTNRVVKDTKHLLHEYAAYGNSNLVFLEEHPDVTDQEEVQLLYETTGIYPFEHMVMEETSYQVIQVYFNLLISYGGEHEEIVVDSASLEYTITRAILKITAESLPVIGVFCGPGVDPLTKEGGFTGLGEVLRLQYEVLNVDLSIGPVSDEVSTLLVLNPKSLGSKEKVGLDQFIMHGGKVVFFIDTVDFQLDEAFLGKKNELPTPWADILGHYGFSVSSELVIDTKSKTRVERAGNRFPIYYSLWPKVKYGSFGDLAFMLNIMEVTLPWVSPVEYTGNLAVKGLEVDYIFTSSEDSYLMEEPFDLNADVFIDYDYIPPGEATEYHMGVIAQGTFNSYYAGKDIPAIENEDGEMERVWDGEITEVSRPTVIVVIGSSFVVSDFALALKGETGNAAFILNLMDSLNLGDGLSRLRSRSVTDPEPEEYEKDREDGFPFEL